MISPTIIAVIANISTAPADMSLASFAFGCLSGIARSTVVSMAVFINSNDITNPNSSLLLLLLSLSQNEFLNFALFLMMMLFLQMHI